MSDQFMKHEVIKMCYEDIIEIHGRRFWFLNMGLEFFMRSQPSKYLIMNLSQREKIYTILMKQISKYRF